jgi:hypothetical protein
MEIMEPRQNNSPSCCAALSPIHGYGLFTKKPIPAGHPLIEALPGEKICYSQIADEALAVDYEWNGMPNNQVLLRRKKTMYSLINHSVNPNAILVPSVRAVVALRDLPAGEEVTLDYLREPLPEAYLTGHGFNYLFRVLYPIGEWPILAEDEKLVPNGDPVLLSYLKAGNAWRAHNAKTLLERIKPGMTLKLLIECMADPTLIASELPMEGK